MKEPLANNSPDWRRIFGALANEDSRRAYAQAILGIEADLGETKHAKALKNLREAGLLNDADSVDERVFARVLAEHIVKKPQEGIARFLTPEGRIERYPKNYGERVALLRHIGDRVLAHGEEADESTLTLRLEDFADDAVLLRRYLVDYSVVIRRADGTGYRLEDGSD